MKSNLSKLEFENSLRKNMVLGDPIWLLTPFWLLISIFRSSNKPFFGEYNESHFRLTKRTLFFPIPYVIEGDYKVLNEFETEIALRIKPTMGVANLWIARILTTLFILILSLAVFSTAGLVDVILAFSILISLLLIIPALIINKRKKEMDKSFKTIFEIVE